MLSSSTNVTNVKVDALSLKRQQTTLLTHYFASARLDWATKLSYFYSTADFHILLPLVSIYTILSSYFLQDNNYYHRFLFTPIHKRSLRSLRGARRYKVRGSFVAELTPFLFRQIRPRVAAVAARRRSTFNNFSLAEGFTPTTLHPFFPQYLKSYQQRYLEMFHPYIRVTNRAVGLPVQEARRITFRWRAFQRNRRNFKRAHFLNILLALTKQVRLTSLTSKYASQGKKYSVNRKDWRLRKRVKSHLIPRQTSYLNSNQRPSPRLSGPIYRVLAGRARSYKKTARRKNRKSLNFRLKSRMMRFNWKFQFQPRRYPTLLKAKTFSKFRGRRELVRSRRRRTIANVSRSRYTINRRVMGGFDTLGKLDKRNKGRHRKRRRSLRLKRISFHNCNKYRKHRRWKRVSRVRRHSRIMGRTLRRSRGRFLKFTRRRRRMRRGTRGVRGTRRAYSYVRGRYRFRRNAFFRRLGRMGFRKRWSCRLRRQNLLHLRSVRPYKTTGPKLSMTTNPLVTKLSGLSYLLQTLSTQSLQVAFCNTRASTSHCLVSYSSDTDTPAYLKRKTRLNPGFRPRKPNSRRSRRNPVVKKAINRIKRRTSITVSLTTAAPLRLQLPTKQATYQIRQELIHLRGWWRFLSDTTSLAPMFKRHWLKREAAKAAKAAKAANVVRTAKEIKAAKAARRRSRKRAKAKGLPRRLYIWDARWFISKRHLADHGTAEAILQFRTSLLARYVALKSEQFVRVTSMPCVRKLSRTYVQPYWLPNPSSSNVRSVCTDSLTTSGLTSFCREVVRVVDSPLYRPSFSSLFSRFQSMKVSAHNPLIYHVKTPSNIRFYSKHEAPFIFSLCGFLFVQTNTLYSSTRRNSSWAFARIQKHQYSFFYKEDIKRFYLKKAGKLKLLASVINPLRFVDHNTLQKNLFRRQLHPITGVYCTPSSGTVAASHMHKLDSGASFLDTRLPVDRERYSNYDYTEAASEPRIKRIRFKPGYSRIWRKARTAINYSLGFHFRYQHALTRRLGRMEEMQGNWEIKIRDWSLLRVVLNSHFVYDLNTSLSLIQSHLVYVNGQCSSNPRLQLHLGDFIQIPVDLKYYILHRWLVNFHARNQLRLTKFTQYKNNKSRYDLSKQKSYHLPDWIFWAGSKSFDIPKYLEVDYFTLSSFIIYEPWADCDFNPLVYLENRRHILRMYNWKYIN